MKKTTHLTLFIFVLLTGTAHVNLTANEEQESEDRTEVCQRMRQIFNTVFQINQRADSSEESKSKKEKELTITEAIAKYHLYDEKRLHDPHLAHLPPDMRYIIPYEPGWDAFFLQ